jgi:outer membrane lipoprotein-sorting protein
MLLPLAQSGRWAFGLILMTASSLHAQEQPDPAMLNAQQILAKVARTYADCKTYQDKGNLETRFIRNDDQFMVTQKPFSTAFVRPGRFRFEYSKLTRENQLSRYIVCRSPDGIQTWWDVTPGVQKHEDLRLAIAGATGVSGGSAAAISSLLLPDELGGTRFTELPNAKRIEDAKLGDHPCFRITAALPPFGETKGRDYTLWIDQKSFLVRRIDFQTKFRDFRTEDTMTFEPKLDAEIDPKLLEFNPHLTREAPAKP